MRTIIRKRLILFGLIITMHMTLFLWQKGPRMDICIFTVKSSKRFGGMKTASPIVFAMFRWKLKLLVIHLKGSLGLNANGMDQYNIVRERNFAGSLN